MWHVEATAPSSPQPQIQDGQCRHSHSFQTQTASYPLLLPPLPLPQEPNRTPLRNGTPLYRYVIKRQRERRVTVNTPSSMATVALVVVFCLRCGEVMTSHFKVELTIPDGKTLLRLPLEGCVAPPLNLTGNRDTPDINSAAIPS